VVTIKSSSFKLDYNAKLHYRSRDEGNEGQGEKYTRYFTNAGEKIFGDGEKPL
jgi:hypothetical protein